MSSPGGLLLVHYLDNFLLVYSDKGVLREAGSDAVRAPVDAGFLISPKSVLEPVVLVCFSGKALNLSTRTVECHPQALLQLWVGWMRLAVGGDEGRHLRGFLGLVKWHVRPCSPGCPFAAGTWFWLRWGPRVRGERQPSQGLPLKLVHRLATLMALAA